ncbi:Glucose-1-phosphate adenylyltransferase [Saliniradius amylolyticus]|uniref:Probable transcriptional regulatory protein HMF8227_01857 n=1 Tax=Saliniradius amylolyticus TaxID=2183582 RepID=A0A2S2E5T6_9ALTE|nr:YebC/PmpR family DNA-binding transcriptional regulator [Saliniradius amylolyticus]AWL12327.1 Glucose-1-phosphate adenylyltransferase [Saliniradius amylolyticus]
MAGHSKWSNIKHRKAAQDAKRGKIFTKLIRELVSATREGGPDADANPRLRAAIDKALSNNMKRDTIDNAIDRGAGNSDGDELETVVYEGYSAGGAAVMVEAMTDNRNRTVMEVRTAFNKCGGNLGTEGSVSFMFAKRGVISYGPEVSEETLMEVGIEAGGEDMHTYEDGSKEIYTAPEHFGLVKDALDKAGLEASYAQVTQVPDNKTELSNADAAKLLKLIDTLEELDDSQDVYTNASITDKQYDALQQ